MIKVSEAEKIVLEHLYQPTFTKVSIDLCLGRVLAEDIYSDRPIPPFDRVTMDGIAISYETFKNGTRDFAISGVASAGKPQMTLESPLECIEVMTGAILPNGTDTVVRYEDVLIKDGKARITIDKVNAGQNIHKKGSDFDTTFPVLRKNKRIGAMDVGLLATVGVESVPVYKMPRVLLISSGDELVDIGQTPEPYQIRKSNNYVIESQLRKWDIVTEQIHLLDDLDNNADLLRLYADKFDAFILSGGVSMGKFDFIPRALVDIGIEEKFHKVAQRPGKPFWFGVKEGLTVFALPGNPVSAYTCFCRYFRPWLENSLFQTSRNTIVKLSESIEFLPNLTYFAQVSVTEESDSSLLGKYIPGNGSGDLINPTLVDGFVELPAEKSIFNVGESYRFFSF